MSAENKAIAHLQSCVSSCCANTRTSTGNGFFQVSSIQCVTGKAHGNGAINRRKTKPRLDIFIHCKTRIFCQLNTENSAVLDQTSEIDLNLNGMTNPQQISLSFCLGWRPAQPWATFPIRRRPRVFGNNEFMSRVLPQLESQCTERFAAMF